MTLHLASFFSGVGGIDLAFRRAGVPTLLTCEIDAAATSVLRRHFPDTVHHRDITEVTADDLHAAGCIPERTVLAGGFPCQDLSVAGARRGMGQGTRSGLYWHLDRLMADFRPAWVVLENVPGLLSSHGGRDMGAVVGSLADRGYGWAYRVLDAQHFGVPQRRRRVVIVGRLGDSGAAPAEVLLEPEGGGGDSASRVASREVAATAATRGVGEVVGALAAHHGRNDADSAAGGHFVPMTFQKVIRSGARDEHGDLPPEVWAPRDVAATLNLNDLGSESRAVELVVQPLAIRGREGGAELELGPVGGPYNALRAGDGGSSRQSLVAITTLGDHTHALTAEGHDASEDGTGRGTPIIAATLTAGTSRPGVSAPGRRREGDHNLVAFHLTQDPISGSVSPPLGAKSGGQGIADETTVRRLTPLECERLQGHPDGWTDVNGMSDSQRYRQMGNAVAVPVFEWVARRLVAVDADMRAGAAA